MLKDITLGQYFPGDTVAHRLDARTKILLVMLYIIALFCVLYITYCQIYDGHRISLSRISELIGSQLLALLLADALMYGVIWLLTNFPKRPE